MKWWQNDGVWMVMGVVVSRRRKTDEDGERVTATTTKGVGSKIWCRSKKNDIQRFFYFIIVSPNSDKPNK